MSDPRATNGLGVVTGIHVADGAGAPMQALSTVEATAGVGLTGDRYSRGTGHFSPRPREDGGRQVTLIEEEATKAAADAVGVEFRALESRRNLATRGVSLNMLIGYRFRIGGAVMDGCGVCRPCTYLEEVTGKPVRQPLVDRGGLRARIVQSGPISIGDRIEVVGLFPVAPTSVV